MGVSLTVKEKVGDLPSNSPGRETGSGNFPEGKTLTRLKVHNSALGSLEEGANHDSKLFSERDHRFDAELSSTHNLLALAIVIGHPGIKLTACTGK